MSKYNIQIGDIYGRLTVKEKTKKRVSGGYDVIAWKCQCECGKETIVTPSHLAIGKVKSCGCLQRDRAREANVKHGDYNERLYKIRSQMIARCYSPNSQSYSNYGGRGITVCDEWLGENGYGNFKKWALSNGYRDNLSIDRIDVNGNYEPLNCRWADDFIQNNNTRRNVKITYNGETHSLSEWGRIKPNGLCYDTLRSRLRDGWSIEDAFSKPHFDGGIDVTGNIITIDGETHNVTWWCEKNGIAKSTFYRRLKRGWSVEKAATMPHDETKLSKSKRNMICGGIDHVV